MMALCFAAELGDRNAATPPPHHLTVTKHNENRFMDCFGAVVCSVERGSLSLALSHIFPSAVALLFANGEL
jgi:hypothetical protein